MSLLASTLEAVVVERPEPTEDEPQHLCLDKAYDNRTGYAVAEQLGYTPHIRRIGEEKQDEAAEKKYPARRWAVERTFSWLSPCRRLSLDYQRLIENSQTWIWIALSRVLLRRLA